MRRLLDDQYSSAGKGDDGLPNGERVLRRTQMRMAAEEVIKEWVGFDKISDAALELFLNRNFENVWKNYDGFNTDAVPLSQAQHFLRDLFQQAPTQPAGGKNPKSIDGFEVTNIYDKVEPEVD